MHLRKSNRKLHPNEPGEPEQQSLGEGDLSTYHLGGGWYEINGEKVQGKDNAIEILKEED